MNDHMRRNLNSAVGYLKAFQDSMRLAAMKDDGLVDEKEKRVLKKLDRATRKYLARLNRLE